MTNEALIKGLFSFIDQSPTPFHAVKNAVSLAQEAGFTLLDEKDTWRCEANKAYIITRNDSSLIALRTGKSLNTGIKMVGAHTDSPCLKIKPNADIQRQGYWQLGVEVYGGALLHPWFDRDLSIAGRVSGLTNQGELFHSLVDFKQPIGMIPSLAIHLNRDANKNSSINPQTDIPLVIAQNNDTTRDKNNFKQLLIDQCDTNAANILDYELYCYDTQPAALVGLQQEFISSARLDNLLSTYLGLRAVIDSSSDQACLFIANDHEEVGSASACGAQGPFLKSVLKRLCASNEELSQIVGRSTLLSCDNAHGIHPNFADKHDANHGPILNKGPVIKINANQRYATNSVSSAEFQHLCSQANIPVQFFVVRSDMACGSTIGPITASELGINTIDIGAPQWAMHSIRETAGSTDVDYLYQAISAFIKSE